MIVPQHVRAIGVLVFACGLALHGGQTAEAQETPRLTPEEQEVFLREARIVSVRELGTGVTASRRATLTDGRVTHDAHIQTVDIYRPVFEAGRDSEIDFRDSYRYNIAAFRLARLIGMENVPASVEREYERTPAAYTWWVNDAMEDGERRKLDTRGPNPVRYVQQAAIRNVFDELIRNRDRNQGNMLWTPDWTMWLIDHTRAFRTDRDLESPSRLETYDRRFLERLRGLTREQVQEAMGRVLLPRELDGLIARRDLIVRHFDRLIAQRGEGAVLFILFPAPPVEAAPQGAGAGATR